jgi:hypothetical protein
VHGASGGFFAGGAILDTRLFTCPLSAKSPDYDLAMDLV